MLFGPWLTARHPMPSPSTATRSQWIGFGSRMSAAIVFIFSALTDSRHQGDSSLPTSTHTSAPPRKHEGVGRRSGDASVAVTQLQPKRDDVERPGSTADLAIDADDFTLDVIRSTDLERPAQLERRFAEH